MRVVFLGVFFYATRLRKTQKQGEKTVTPLPAYDKFQKNTEPIM